MYSFVTVSQVIGWEGLLLCTSQLLLQSSYGWYVSSRHSQKKASPAGLGPNTVHLYTNDLPHILRSHFMENQVIVRECFHWNVENCQNFCSQMLFAFVTDNECNHWIKKLSCTDSGVYFKPSGLLRRCSLWHHWHPVRNKLQSVQNAAARLLTQTGRREHITPVLRQLHSTGYLSAVESTLSWQC